LIRINGRFIFVGKTKEKYVIQALDKYCKILKKYGNIEICEIKAEKFFDNLSNYKKKESQKILKNINENSFKIFLDLKGKEFSSEQLASHFSNLFSQGIFKFDFIIGGAYGFDDSILKQADLIWKLSDLTFNHQMIRIILMEQFYRILSIINGENYHH